MIRTRLIVSSAGLAFALVALSGCGGGGGNTAGGTPPVTVVTPKPEDQIGGTSFGTAYRADPNTDATDPAPGSLPAVDPARDPQPI